MKRFLSILTLLGILVGCCGCSQPSDPESTLPTGDYLMILVDPNAVYSVLPESWASLHGGYLVRLSNDTDIIVLAVSAQDPSENAGHEMLTSDGGRLVFYKEDGRYRFEKSITKTKSCYSEDDELLWEMTINATFLYDRTSVECTDVSGEVYIAATGSWYVISETPEASGNTASYTVEFGRSALGITTSSSSYTITVSCDTEGNLS